MSGEAMRDRFAMAALMATWANPTFNDMSPDATARSCYLMADAMLTARGGDAPQPVSDAVVLLEHALNIATGYDIDDGSLSFRSGQEHAANKIAKRIKALIRANTKLEQSA